VHRDIHSAPETGYEDERDKCLRGFYPGAQRLSRRGMYVGHNIRSMKTRRDVILDGFYFRSLPGLIRISELPCTLAFTAFQSLARKAFRATQLLIVREKK
jgi:hypothetical protein